MTEATKISRDDGYIDEQRQWLVSHKAETGLTWEVLAAKTGVKAGTLSPFAVNKYPGDNSRIAEAVALYRQTLAKRAEMVAEMPQNPGFFVTPRTVSITTTLTMAQMGSDITLVTGAPGTSKTSAALEYQAARSNVWYAAMKPSTGGINTMQQKVLAALGVRDAKGAPLALTLKIEGLVKGTGGLLIIDEAHWLSLAALEEIRGWHDETLIGVCLIGNDDTLLRMTLGNKRDDFARVSSRCGQRLVFRGPTTDCALALADAWSVTAEDQRAFVVDLAKKPGGLRTCTKVMRIATMLANGERRARSLSDIQDAWSFLSVQKAAS